VERWRRQGRYGGVEGAAVEEVEEFLAGQREESPDLVVRI